MKRNEMVREEHKWPVYWPQIFLALCGASGVAFLCALFVMATSEMVRINTFESGFGCAIIMIAVLLGSVLIINNAVREIFSYYD